MRVRPNTHTHACAKTDAHAGAYVGLARNRCYVNLCRYTHGEIHVISCV
jgi:hypothetical protein